jgi:hypothetical protein
MLLGVCSVDDSKMKFYPKSELEKGEEQKPLWEIDFQISQNSDITHCTISILRWEFNFHYVEKEFTFTLLN